MMIFRLRSKRKNLRKLMINLLPNQKVIQRKSRKNQKKSTKNLAIDYDSTTDDFQVEPNLKERSNTSMNEDGNVDFKIKPVSYKNSPKKQIEIVNDNSNSQKITFTNKTQADPKLKPKFIFSKIQKD